MYLILFIGLYNSPEILLNFSWISLLLSKKMPNFFPDDFLDLTKLNLLLICEYKNVV